MFCDVTCWYVKQHFKTCLANTVYQPKFTLFAFKNFYQYFI